jgi:hypothetical protein
MKMPEEQLAAEHQVEDIELQEKLGDNEAAERSKVENSAKRQHSDANQKLPAKLPTIKNKTVAAPHLKEKQAVRENKAKQADKGQMAETMDWADNLKHGVEKPMQQLAVSIWPTSTMSHPWEFFTNPEDPNHDNDLVQLAKVAHTSFKIIELWQQKL